MSGKFDIRPVRGVGRLEIEGEAGLALVLEIAGAGFDLHLDDGAGYDTGIGELKLAVDSVVVVRGGSPDRSDLVSELLNKNETELLGGLIRIEQLLRFLPHGKISPLPYYVSNALSFACFRAFVRTSSHLSVPSSSGP